MWRKVKRNIEETKSPVCLVPIRILRKVIGKKELFSLTGTQEEAIPEQKGIILPGLPKMGNVFISATQKTGHFTNYFPLWSPGDICFQAQGCSLQTICF